MSAILSADDLNDFISPGVACIKPVETLPKQEDYNPYEVTTEDKVQAQNPAPASISLTDCLACSGCVTSAEAVLVSLQSHNEVLNTLDAFPSIDLSQHSALQNGAVNGHSPIPSDAKIFVASISPQVRASIAATFGISERRAGYMIEQFLSGSQGLRLGGNHNSTFSYVVDTNRMREACLVLGADEVAASIAEKSRPKPILTSACPGWICYAEKTHPHILPHLSNLKSPQALTGTILKSVLSKSLNIYPSQIWHLSIMPCFDKKLEASREELTDKHWSLENSDSSPVRDVDCVITSRELVTLAEARGIKLSSLPMKPLRKSEQTTFPHSILSRFLFPQITHRSTPIQSSEAGTSGGYLHHILLTQQNLHPSSKITTQRGRNADVVEYTLTTPANPNTPIIKCARYYGFRNIQNLVRKLKPAKQSRLPGAATSSRRLNSSTTANAPGTDYTYIEVMACPGGCTNGGGQIKIEDVAAILPETRGEMINAIDMVGERGVKSQKEWLARVDEAYFSLDSGSDFDSDFDTNSDVELSNGNDTVDTNMKDDDETINEDEEKRNNIINGIDIEAVHEMLACWSKMVDVPLEKLAYTTFRKVESDVGKKSVVKKMGDSERIAAIAGLQGGGW